MPEPHFDSFSNSGRWSQHALMSHLVSRLNIQESTGWKVLDTLESDMNEHTLDTPLNTNSISNADQANPSQAYAAIPAWGSDIDWSVPSHVGGLVATSKDWDSSMLSC